MRNENMVAVPYITARVKEYPSFEEQLDMLYWDRKRGTNHWETYIDVIKANHPKPPVETEEDTTT